MQNIYRNFLIRVWALSFIVLTLSCAYAIPFACVSSDLEELDARVAQFNTLEESDIITKEKLLLPQGYTAQMAQNTIQKGINTRIGNQISSTLSSQGNIKSELVLAFFPDAIEVISSLSPSDELFAYQVSKARLKDVSEFFYGKEGGKVLERMPQAIRLMKYRNKEEILEKLGGQPWEDGIYGGGGGQKSFSKDFFATTDGKMVTGMMDVLGMEADKVSLYSLEKGSSISKRTPVQYMGGTNKSQTYIEITLKTPVNNIEFFAKSELRRELLTIKEVALQ